MNWSQTTIRQGLIGLAIGLLLLVCPCCVSLPGKACQP